MTGDASEAWEHAMQLGKAFHARQQQALQYIEQPRSVGSTEGTFTHMDVSVSPDIYKAKHPLTTLFRWETNSSLPTRGWPKVYRETGARGYCSGAHTAQTVASAPPRL